MNLSGLLSLRRYLEEARGVLTSCFGRLMSCLRGGVLGDEGSESHISSSDGGWIFRVLRSDVQVPGPHRGHHAVHQGSRVHEGHLERRHCGGRELEVGSPKPRGSGMLSQQSDEQGLRDRFAGARQSTSSLDAEPKQDLVPRLPKPDHATLRSSRVVDGWTSE